MSEPAFDLDAAWRQIESVPSPGPAGRPPRPVLPRLVGRTAGAAARALRVLRRSSGAAGEEERRDHAIEDCVRSIREIESRWLKECGETGFVRRRRELFRSKQILEGIAVIEAQEKRGREDRQRDRRKALRSALRRGVGELLECRRAVLARRAELSRQLEEEYRRIARLRAELAPM